MMKTIQFGSIQILFTVFLTAFCQEGNCQKITIWKGGTPGMENHWYCPQNWSTSSVPDEFSNVIIPDVSKSTFSSPELLAGIVEVNSLRIEQHGALSISKEAKLVILERAVGISANSVTGNGEVICLSDEMESQKKMLANTVKQKNRYPHSSMITNENRIIQ